MRATASRVRWFWHGRFLATYRSAIRRCAGLPTARLTRRLVALDEIIRDDIGLPPLHGPADHDDITAALTIAAAIQPQLVVEFGTAYGNLTANICRFTPGRIITVNALPQQISGVATTFAPGPSEIGRAYRAHGYGERVTQVFANTTQVDLAPLVGAAQVDLGIVDACHDTAYVYRDFLKIAALVRPGGAVLLHDTHPSMHDHLGGSYVACAGLRLRGFDIRHIEGTWWGLWVKGGLARSALGQLLV